MMICTATRNANKGLPFSTAVDELTKSEHGTYKPMSEFFEQLRVRAEKGSTAAQIELAHSLLTGFDPYGEQCLIDYGKAKQLLERAHEERASTATYILGTMYEEGKGVLVDILKAISLYERAASSGAYLPCVNLARIYAHGSGVFRSPELAAKWYRKVVSFEKEVEYDDDMREAKEFLRQHGQS